MTGIAIYIEGGGDSRDSKAQLRQGFEALLEPQKHAARIRRLRWKLVLCGGRNATFDAFQHATATAGSEIVVLLVDAEAPVATVYASLEAATKHTQKGSYGKIKHASELLKRMKPAIVATRCASFQDFTKSLDAAIAEA